MNTTSSIVGKTIETEIDVEQILETGKRRRANDATRAQIIDNFRKTAERNVGHAIINFVVALSQGGIAYLGYSHPPSVDRQLWNVQVLISVMLTAYFVLLGIRRIWVSPRDRFLLLLIDDLEIKKTE